MCIPFTSVNENKTEKGIRWMPWYYEPMKDVVTDETLRGAGKQALIRGCPNGETYMCEAHMPICRGVCSVGTVRSETSQ
jgi:hypothetical protein